MEALGKFFTTVILSIISIFVRGWVVMKLWAWFIVPTFSMEPLRMIEALGLSLTVALLTAEMKMDEYSDDEDIFLKTVTRFIFLLTAHLVILLFGWIYSLFM